MKSEAVKKPHLLWFDLTRNQSTEELMLPFRATCHCLLDTPGPGPTSTASRRQT